jgi:hypothetical protein
MAGSFDDALWILHELFASCVELASSFVCACARVGGASAFLVSSCTRWPLLALETVQVAP